ncbi:DUF7094 domain-containing protein [Natronocalculus amylovorans]|uniref:Uncharacterized protein n=1 Tax=Natronocalculus amylovorans TaxID=2917812 RepID=A0AAE3FUW5_9EURY|nr:hypothetical protein [Natronocalculus amylovorans]MCL9815783.1 hypothetical protein [Natronocalculus amylovorans]NUE01705.1 hypothetical protein [Halorubraceae archaeon YAN]
MRLFPFIFVLFLFVGLGVGGASGSLTDISPTLTVGEADSTDSPIDAETQLTTDTSVAQIEENITQTRTLANDPDSVVRVELDREHADLGPAIIGQTDRTAAQITLGSIEKRLADAESDSERQRRVLDELNTIEQQIITLEENQQQAITQYNEEEIDSHQFVSEIVKITHEAEALEERMGVLVTTANEAGTSIDSNRRQGIESSLGVFSGPVRTYGSAILTGAEQPDRIYVETSDDGIVLSAIDGDTYTREVLRSDRRDRGGGTIDLEDAEDVVQASYPEIWNESSTIRVDGSGSTVRVSITTETGELIAFVDGGSEQVFKEHRQETVSEVVPTNETTRAQSGLNVTVQQTYVGGPLLISVVDSNSGAPVEEATVTVGQGSEESDVVGKTDSDGELYALEPRGTYTVAVLSGTNTAFVELDSNEPRALGTR